MTYPADEDPTSIRVTIVILALAVAAALLAGCSEARSLPEPVPAPPSVADEIRAIGYTFLRYGGLILGLGMVIRAVVWVASLGWIAGVAGTAASWVARVLGPFVGLGAVAGGASVAFGACCVWMADYLWIVVLAGVVTSVAVVWYYWPRIWARIRARLNARKA